jgi:hypothetical protein
VSLATISLNAGILLYTSKSNFLPVGKLKKNVLPLLLPRNEQNNDKNIERLIYNTVSKYIIQMLNAGTGKIYFPEIIPIENHSPNLSV